MKDKVNFGGWETFQEKIKKGMKIPPKDKLTWLKDINDFTYKALTEKDKKINRIIRENKP